MAGSTGLSRLFGTRSVESEASVYRIVGAADGGWSLTPMENLLRGVRTENETLALELYSYDGVVNYCLRSQHGSGLVGMLKSYFPQAKVSGIAGSLDSEDVSDDWLDLAEQDHALVQTLYLEHESYLPLRIFDDATLRQSEMDPLAGVIGLLGNSSRSDGEFPGFRLGMRLVVRPAKETWNMSWRDRIQERRDGDDRPRNQSNEGPPMGLVMAGLGAAVFAGVNFYLWQGGHMAWMVPANMAMLAAAAGGALLLPKLSSPRKRSYIDDHLVEDKLKSLAFWSEMQLFAIYHEVEDGERVRAALSGLVDCLRSYDDAVGNSWRLGRLAEYQGMDTFEEKTAGVSIPYPFRGGRLNMEWMSRSDAMKTVLSAREVASLWHPPLGSDEMASMERSTSVQLIPYLGDLVHGTDSTGPHVGDAGVSLDSPIFLPESALRKHTLILGRSGVGKSTMVKHILSYKLHRKAQGFDNSAIVVIDPHADLVQDVLLTVPPELVPKIRLLDFGRLDRVPGINLLDPELFTDRDRCVDTIVTTLRYLWEAWGNRLEDLLKRSLLMMYEYNAHPDTPRDSYLTMMDILRLLDDGVNSSSGASQEPQFSPFQSQVIKRVKDPSLISWFRSFLNWGRETKGDAVGPVHSRIGAYESNLRSSVIMGQRESTLLLSDVLEEGLVLLVSTAQGTIGVQPAALMGGTMVSLVESALRDQESIPSGQRKRCTLFCDEFQTVTGANWEGMLAEIRKYGGSLVLATQSVVRLDQGERRLKSGVLANTGCIVSYQVSGEDAHVICQEMNAERVAPHHLVDLDAHHCIVRINSDTKCYPAFSMKTKPPPEYTHRYDESVQAVLEASEAYTIDWAQARAAIEAEGMRKLHPGSGPGSSQAGPDSGRADGGGSRRSGPRNTVDGVAEERRRKAGDARNAALAEANGSGDSSGGDAPGDSPPSVGRSDGGSPSPRAGRPLGPVPGVSPPPAEFGRVPGSPTASVGAQSGASIAVVERPARFSEAAAAESIPFVAPLEESSESSSIGPAEPEVSPDPDPSGPVSAVPDSVSVASSPGEFGPSSPIGDDHVSADSGELPAGPQPESSGSSPTYGEALDLGGVSIPISELSVGNFYDLVESCRSDSSFSDDFLAELERVGPKDPLLQKVLRAYLGDSWNSIRRQAANSARSELRQEVRAELEPRLEARYSGQIVRQKARMDELEALLEGRFGVTDVAAALREFLAKPTVDDVRERTDVELTSTLQDQKDGVKLTKRRQGNARGG